MTDTQIREIRERCEAATPGPWRAVWKGNSIKSHLVYADGLEVRNIACGISPKTGNAEFIACARKDVPALLYELDRLREAAKGAAVIADSAGQTIRELRGQNEQLFDDLTRSRTHADLTAKLVYDAVKTREKAKDRLRKQIAHTVRARRQRDGLTAENDRLRAELEAAKRDLAAISDKYMICFTCKHDHGGGISDCGKYGCSKTNMYEWAGPVAENTPAPEMGV